MEIRREQEFVRNGFALWQVLGTETGAPFPSDPLTACLEALKVPDPAVPRTHPTSLARDPPQNQAHSSLRRLAFCSDRGPRLGLKS